MAAQEHPVFLMPRDRGAKLWRYMDFDKFCWMLRYKALYFRRSDLFKDPLEGHFSKANDFAEDFFVEQQIKNGGFGAPDETSEDDLRVGYRKMLSVAAEDRKHLFVNCWHMNDTESLEMWNEYANHNEAVCVQTSFKSLWDLLPNDCFLGGVRYIDHHSSIMDVTMSLYPIAHKDMQYAREREVRAVVWEHADTRARFQPSGDDALFVSLDLSALIETVYLHPNASSSHATIIRDLVASNNIKAPVKYSGVRNSKP
jgi:hypothetical protein